MESSSCLLPDDGFFIKFIRDFLAADFRAFSVPVDEVEKILEPFLFEDSPYFTRLWAKRKFIDEHRYQLLTESNFSSYELIDAKVISKDRNSCVCETSEFWYMVFKSEADGKQKTDNQKNSQVYFFRKINGIWKLWNNYNPDTGHWEKKFDIKQQPGIPKL